MSSKISAAGGASTPDDEPGDHPARVEGQAHERPGEQGDRFAGLNDDDVPDPGQAPDFGQRPAPAAPKSEWVGFALRVNELLIDEPLPVENPELSTVTKPQLIEAYGQFGTD